MRHTLLVVTALLLAAAARAPAPAPAPAAAATRDDDPAASQPAATSAEAGTPSSAPTSAPGLIEGVDVEALLAGLSLEQKIGQLMFVDFVGTRRTDAIAELIAGKRVGGVALFSHNIKNRSQVQHLLDEIHALDTGGIPPFLSVDQEGGNVVRIKEGDAVLPSAMALGATRSPALAEAAGRVVGRDLRSLGFTMNLAPVLDINSNPRNPVIGIRSLGEDPELVAELGLAFIQGMRRAGVVAVAKHFPGHGATHSDSHYGLPSLPYDLEHLRRVELVPFARAIDGGLEALMTAHIALPSISEGPELPSTLSRRILTGVLREQLGYDGIVITDGLEMRGIVEKYGLGPAAVQAIAAGADMVLVVWTAERKEEVRQALLAAVATGEIPLARVEQSVRRILATKARHHLLPGQRFEPAAVSTRERQVASAIARQAVTLVKNQGEVLPLRPERLRRIVVASGQDLFRRQLERALPGVQVAQVPLRWAPSRQRREADSERVLDQAARADLVVVGLSNSYYKDLVRGLKERFPQKPVVVVSFASPYMLTDFAEVDAYVCAYTYQAMAQSAAAATLVGDNPPLGRLPVSIPGLFAYGHGLDYAAAASTPAQGGALRKKSHGGARAVRAATGRSAR